MDFTQSLLADLYAGGQAGIQQNPMTQTVQVEGGDYQMPTEEFEYSITDDVDTEINEADVVTQMLVDACAARGGKYNKQTGICEGADEYEPETPEVEMPEISDSLQGFLEQEGEMGYCSGATGTTKEECIGGGGNFISYYGTNPETGEEVNIFTDLRGWLKATYPDLDEEAYQYFDTMTFDQADFKTFLESVSQQSKENTDFTNRAYNIAQEARNNAEEKINKDLASGLISNAQAEELRQEVLNYAEESYSRATGSEEFINNLNEALSDGSLTQEEYEALKSTYDEEGITSTIFRDISNRADRLIEEKRLSETKAQTTYDLALQDAKDEFDESQGLLDVGLDRALSDAERLAERERNKNKRTFLSSYQQAQDSLMARMFAQRNAETGFVASGGIQEQQDIVNRQASEQMARLTLDAYLPALEQIAEDRDIDVARAEEDYARAEGILLKDRTKAEDRAGIRRDAIIDALQTDFGLSLNEIGAQTQDIIQSTQDDISQARFDAKQRKTEIQNEKQQLLNRYDALMDTAGNEQEKADLELEIALNAIKAETEASIGAGGSLLDDYIGTVLAGLQEFDTGEITDNQFADLTDDPEAPEGYPLETEPTNCPEGKFSESTDVTYTVEVRVPGPDGNPMTRTEERVKTFWSECKDEESPPPPPPPSLPKTIEDDTTVDIAEERYGSKEGAFTSQLTGKQYG
jgi:hypothetical protein